MTEPPVRRWLVSPDGVTHAGVAFTELDNGLRLVEDPVAAHRVCGRVSAGHVRALLTRMTAVIPDLLMPVDWCDGV